MTIEQVGTLYFAAAIIHTFSVQFFLKLSKKFPQDSTPHALFHFLGEIECVFGIWALVFMIHFILLESYSNALAYFDSLNFTEPMFVFAVMLISASRPILFFARQVIQALASLIGRSLPLEQKYADLFILLTIGPLSGSFITEPAAMTVTALLLKDMLIHPSKKLIYSLLAVLFVNISIGGAMTPYAAPPILMVATTWGWDLHFTLINFAWKVSLASALNAAVLIGFCFTDIKKSFLGFSEVRKAQVGSSTQKVPFVLTFIHLIFLTFIIMTAHHPSVFIGLLLFFLGVTVATKQHQDLLRFKESLLVAFFLGGIIVFGSLQKWWLQPLLSQLTDGALFWGATALTAITDNAALTYLGSQVSGLADSTKYSLVAGAITGGGLTVIANAPNAAGFSILNTKFPNGIFNPLALFAAALVPTLIAALCLV